MNYISGVPIDKEVKEQLQLRQNSMGLGDRDSSLHYYSMQKRIPWIVMSSGVNLKGDLAKVYRAGSQLAQNNQLKAIQANQTLPGYVPTTSLGIRPQPGILSAKVHSHNRFGSLRTATVSYVCWSKEQLDILELLYMRPGMTVLLEWGHSVYLKANSSDDKIVLLARPVTGNDSQNFFSEKGIKDIQSVITKKRVEYGYSYDAVYGLIKNFSFSLRPDGGYDCTTSIVSMGDLVESLKINFFISQKDIHERTLKVFNDVNNELKALSGGKQGTFTASNGNTATVTVYTPEELAKLKSVSFPTVDEMENFSPIKDIVWPETPDGKEGQALYNNYVSRVRNILAGKSDSGENFVTPRRVTTDGEEYEVSIVPFYGLRKIGTVGPLYVNPENKTFAFTNVVFLGGNTSGYNFENLTRLANALVAKNPDVEILRLRKGFAAAVLRFKS